MKSGQRRVWFLLGLLPALSCGMGRGEAILRDTSKLPAQLAEYYRLYDNVALPARPSAAVELVNNVAAALAGLVDKEDATAKAAGDYLVAVLDQTLADEKSGAAGWHATPYWGEEAENPARQTRKRILEWIEGNSDEQIPTQTVGMIIPLTWFVRAERVVTLRFESFGVLERITGQQADALILALAGDSTLPHGIQSNALKQAASRGLNVAVAVIRAALTDWHDDLRGAAKEYWQKRGQGEVPATFDPLAAMARPRITDLLNSAVALIPDLPAADARWVRVETNRHDTEDGKTRDHKSCEYGWQLEKTGDRLRILNLHGRVSWIQLGKRRVAGLNETTTCITRSRCRPAPNGMHGEKNTAARNKSNICASACNCLIVINTANRQMSNISTPSMPSPAAWPPMPPMAVTGKPRSSIRSWN